MKKAIMVLLVLITAASCTSARISANLSSGVIGCLPEEIIIRNETASVIGGMHNFEAICNGKRYICSYQPSTGINCKEAPEDPAEQNANFEGHADGIVKNTFTGIEWKVGPDKDMNWNEANSWVEGLNLTGDVWRMPSEDELRVLYRKGVLQQKLALLISGWGVWSAETKGSEAKYFYFVEYGDGYWYGRDVKGGMRAFAVRSRK